MVIRPISWWYFVAPFFFSFSYDIIIIRGVFLSLLFSNQTPRKLSFSPSASIKTTVCALSSTPASIRLSPPPHCKSIFMESQLFCSSFVRPEPLSAHRKKKKKKGKKKKTLLGGKKKFFIYTYPIPSPINSYNKANFPCKPFFLLSTRIPPTNEQETADENSHAISRGGMGCVA